MCSPEEIHTQHPFMASFRNSKVSGAGSVWYDFFLNKTVSEKLLSAKYAIRNILLGNGNIQKNL